MQNSAQAPTEAAHAPTRGEALPAWKRGFDLACCFAALPLLAMGVLVMTAVARLWAPGPVLFKQERVGHQGRRFLIYKFRTMKVSAEVAVHAAYVQRLIAEGKPMTKLDRLGDSRLIPGGRLLRASGLDELPQVINVLLGEMSVVGPRPCLPAEFEHYLPEQRRRVEAVPGLTGLWQVSGKNRTTFGEMIRLDLTYAQTLSPTLDLKIVLRTPGVLLRQLREAGRQGSGPAVEAATPASGTEPSRNVSLFPAKS